MKKAIIASVAAAMVLSVFVGCATTESDLGRFTIISSANVPLGDLDNYEQGTTMVSTTDLNKKGTFVSEKELSESYVLENALDSAMKSQPGTVALVSAKLKYIVKKGLFGSLSYGYVFEGYPLVPKGTNARNAANAAAKTSKKESKTTVKTQTTGSGEINLGNAAATINLAESRTWDTNVLEGYATYVNINPFFNGKLPKKGDKVHIVLKGKANRNISSLDIYPVDNSAAAGWFKMLGDWGAVYHSAAINAGSDFYIDYTFTLVEDPVEAVSIRLFAPVGNTDGEVVIKAN